MTDSAHRAKSFKSSTVDEDCMSELQKIKSLIERYGSARVQEELAGFRDAPNGVLKRHYDNGKSAYSELIKIIEDLLAAAGRT